MPAQENFIIFQVLYDLKKKKKIRKSENKINQIKSTNVQENLSQMWEKLRFSCVRELSEAFYDFVKVAVIVT